MNKEKLVFKIKNHFTKQKIVEIIEITFGVLLLTIGFYFFLLPASLVTGGVLGLSIIFQELVNSEEIVSLFVTVVNMVLLVIGGLVLGKKFFLKTVYGSVLLSVFLFLFEKIFRIDSNIILNQISEGKLLLSAIFGGILSGAGLGFVLRNNATTGGMDILQRMANKFLKIPFSIALYLIDGTVVILGVIFTKSIEGGFYAIGSLLIIGVAIDQVMLRGKSGYTVFIVTQKFDLLKDAIYQGIDRGITKIDVIGGYSENNKNMIICTITKNQLYHIKNIIEENDPNAFTFITKTNETLGSGFRREDV